ncbi:AzlC family ABC transporter permease [Clostridium sp. MB40-C1]|uniref:AzlC family ABC transporter permease n=1 Tax=Clostridium sp. MB40-C1 TaxID=3070996 RepID=UPI0027DF946F|nr:AzlC family ABC transporter permease [Clostridium sp. MB40-C1]WMJ79070.1 AzlC family ABC transporter permease [Clostridium sp. MB40-C1]
METGVYIENKKNFKQGIKEGIPIFMGYFPIALTFGLIARASGLNGGLAVAMAFTNFSGASQFIGVSMLAQGSGIGNIILTTFMINARYLLMSFCVANKLSSSIKKKIKGLLAFGLTDEVFVVSMTKDELEPSFMFGVQFISHIGWVGGTLTGVILANILPKSISSSIGIAIYIMFLGLLLPAIKGSMKIATVSIIAMIISSIIYWVPFLNKICGNWRIVITIVLASLIGAKFIPMEEGVCNE